MTAQLTVHNAQVTTATVEIKTLTVSGKQVTLAVFRQLRDKPLIDADDGQLLGQPWGTVNYHPDKCADWPEHLHVVWQDGEQLCRARISQPSWWSTAFYSESSDELIQAEFCLAGHSRKPGWQRAQVDGDYCIRFRLDGMLCDTAVEPRWRGREGKPHECMTEQERDEYREIVLADIAGERQRRSWISDHWKLLSAIPQLFIAV